MTDMKAMYDGFTKKKEVIERRTVIGPMERSFEVMNAIHDDGWHLARTGVYVDEVGKIDTDRFMFIAERKLPPMTDTEPIDDFHRHEVLDRASLAVEFFSENVESHAATAANPRLKDAAAEVTAQLARFYQLVAAENLKEDTK